VSLTGNLEDLPLLDILQIVSFSKKTGHLSIGTPEGQGAIVFRDGFVVCCFTPDSEPLDPQSARLPIAQRSIVIRKRIEVALERLIRLHEGKFNFSLTEELPATIGTRDIRAETLADGINPQELVLDLARGIDEDRRNSSAAIEVAFSRPEEDSFEEDLTTTEAEGDSRLLALEPPPEEPIVAAPAPAAPVPVAATAPVEQPRTVLLVDDEDDVRALLAAHITAAGYEVVEAGEPDLALKQAHQLKTRGVDFLLVVDLGMPTSGGSSFQGGFEIVKRLGKMHLRPATLIMTESPTPSVQARARQMGIAHLVFKPGLSKLDPDQFRADMTAFAGRITEHELPRLTRRAPPAPKPEVRAAAAPASAMTPDERSREFAVLQRHLDELRRPESANQISALLMRAAREFFERSVLFLIKNDEARGLGGFGRAPRDQKIGLLVRDVAVPLKEPSLLRDVVASGKSFVGPSPEGRWEQYLLGKIGRFQAAGFALVPLLAHRETIAVLFGDNPETGRELGRLEALEVVVSQAGIAFENVFLQRKIELLQRG
jgi:CheY-like chemotaxis protein